MGFRGVTFGGENVNPKNDGGLYQAHHGDGILWGCGMSLDIPNHKLNIMKGELIACGRVIEVDGATEVDLSAMSQDYVRVVLNIDLSNLPPYTSLDESASISGFGSLTQGDLNDNDTVYQIELAIVQQSGGNPASISRSIGGSALVSAGGVQSDGNISLYSPSGVRRAVNLYENDVLVGRLRNNAVTGYTEVGTVNSDGTLKAGLRASNASQVEVFANNGTIKLCPKGANDTTNDVEIDTNGQIHGGCLMPADSTKSSQSISANTWTSVCSQTLGAGTWLLMGTASFKCLGTSSNDWAMINIGASNGATACRNSTALGGGTSVYLGLNGFYITTVNSSQTYNLYVEASANTTVQNCVLRAVQIG